MGLTTTASSACEPTKASRESGRWRSLAPAIQALIYAAPAHNHARGLGELLIGRDPSNPEELWNLMYDATDYIGRRGIVMHAIGGIDLALWDIKGQIGEQADRRTARRSAPQPR